MFPVRLILFVLLFAQTVQGQVLVGANRPEQYLPLLQGKNVALVVNQTSLVKEVHLLDYLLQNRIAVKTVFSPEHGFRGDISPGQKITNSVDEKTGIPIISLYGTFLKPRPEDLKGIDIVIFDIQDVGARFYTFISTLHYLMEACAENHIKLLILDRPNPNAFYVDGPVLDVKFKSFVGMHPVPVVYGMTMGEYAQMINGEKWLHNGITCDLAIIPIRNWDHTRLYTLPVKPSPNLPNMQSVYLYPSICFFEGTDISLGRGTDFPFQVIGSPKLKNGFFSFNFTPKSMNGSLHPPHLNETCYGQDLRRYDSTEFLRTKQINLKWLLDMYAAYDDKDRFFLPNLFFDKLAGSDKLRRQIIKKVPMKKIRASWTPELKAFKAVRKKYLLYKDFE